MRLLFLLPAFLFLTIFGCGGAKQLDVIDLRCENLRNPMGIDNTVPRFSWKIRNNKNETEQKAFQLMVASDPSLLERDEADLWNSGKIQSSSGVLVPCQWKIVLVTDPT